MLPQENGHVNHQDPPDEFAAISGLLLGRTSLMSRSSPMT